jgi:hypothetical protein
MKKHFSFDQIEAESFVERGEEGARFWMQV